MKVEYPTQIIRTMTHYEWRKQLKEAEADGRWDDYAEIKALYTDWRKAERDGASAAAAALGRISTPAKAASSRANGKLGGRPRKSSTGKKRPARTNAKEA